MESLIAIICVASLVEAFYKKQWLWPQRKILISFVGLTVVATISFFVNQLPSDDFISYITELRWTVIYIALLQFFNLRGQKLNWGHLLFCAQMVLVVAGLYAIYQFFYGHDFFRKHAQFHEIYFHSPFRRPNGFFSFPTTYAHSLAMFFPVSLAYWMREPRPTGLRKNLTRLYFGLSSLSIFLTFTRAAWISFFVSTMCILALTRKKLCLRIAFVFIIVTAAAYTGMPEFRNRINSIFDLQYVANHDRIYLWKANWLMFEEHPIWGVGHDYSSKNIDTYLNKINQPDVIRSHPHNTYLNFLVGTGVLGVSFFLLFIGLTLFHTWRGLRESSHHLHKTLYIGAFGLQLVLLIGGLSECMFEDIELTHPFILFAALVEYLRQQDFPQKNMTSSARKNS